MSPWENYGHLTKKTERKMTNCSGCLYEYYEADTNFRDCKHPDFNLEESDKCPGYYSKADAKADVKYSHCDKY